MEETGLTIKYPELCVIKQFQDKNDARYVVLLYKTNHFNGDLRGSNEGKVYWIKQKDLLNYSLAPDFEKMVEVMEDSELSEFYYYKDADNKQSLDLL